MNEITLVIDFETYTFVHSPDGVTLKDMDVNDELLAYKISSLLAPFSLYVVRQLLRDLQGLDHENFKASLYYFVDKIKETQILNLASFDSPVHKSVHLYLAKKLGSSYWGYDRKLIIEEDIKEWFIENYIQIESPNRATSATTQIILLRLASEDLSPKLIKLMARNEMPSSVFRKLIERKDITDEILESIMRTARSNIGYPLQIRLDALAAFKGAISDEIAQMLLESWHPIMAISLAEKNISPKIQQNLVSLPDVEVKEALLNNPHVDKEIKAQILNKEAKGIEI